MKKYFNSRNRAILREMVSTDFKVRYQNSVLGYLWSLLKPLFLFAILYIVFTYIIPLGKGVDHYPVYLLTGVILWNFFTEATVQGTLSVVMRGDLIRKISIPRYLVVIASACSALINLSLSLVVILIFALLNGIMPSFEWLLIILLIIELFIFALGISLFLSALFVKFRDISYIWEIFMQAGFYATPIIYPLMNVPTYLHKWFFINPVAQIIQDARYVLVTKTSVTIWNTVHSLAILIPFIIVIAALVIGSLYFKRHSKYFAEDI
jgi:ABC-2 type transport system permease protein